MPMTRKPKPSGKKESFGKPRQIGDLRRLENHRLVNKKIIIVVEGKETEKNYFINIKKYYRKHALKIEVYSGNGKTDILSLLNKAIDLLTTLHKNSEWDDDIDQIWVVCDTEDIHNDKKIQAGRAQANKGGINLAISNPCFEYWGILHFEKTSRPFFSPDEAKKYLRSNYIDRYTESTDFFAYTNNLIHFALSNVNELRNENTEHWELIQNPSTSIDYLIREIIR